MAEPTLFDEASLALIASGGAGKDGKVYSIKPVPEYGPEKVTNGDFATDSNWNKGSGTTISGGKANFSNASSVSLYQNIGTPGSVRATFSVTDYTSGSLKIYAGGYPIGTSLIEATAVGDYSVEINTTGGNGNIIFGSSDNFTGSIDNVSIKQIISGDFTFSRGSNLSATRVGPDGLIEKGRENVMRYSNQFTASGRYSTSASTIELASNEIGYNGNSDVWELAENNATISHWIRDNQDSITGVGTISVYAKYNGRHLQLRPTGIGSGVAYANFDLISGVKGTSDGSGYIDSTITRVGDTDWYRCSLTINHSGNYQWLAILIGSTSATELPSYPGDGTSGIYMQNAQLEAGLAATEYIESGATTGKAGLLENEPRFDYSGGVTCPSLLKEKPRTNLLPSEYFGAYNALNGSSITTNYSASPEGYNNATRLQLNSQSLSRIELAAGGTSVANKSHSVSCWVKSNGADAEFRLKCTHASVLDYHSPNLTATSEWQRFTFTQLFGAGSSNAINAGILNGTSNNAADLSIYGFQLEQDSSYPTSYIPNHSGGTITRSGELANYVTVGGGSEKWSLMYEFDFNKTPLQQNEIFSNIRNATSDVAITFRHFIRDSVKHVISPYFNLEPAYPFGSAGASSVTDSSVLLRANGDGSYDYFASLNGVVTKASVTGMSNIAFSRIDLGAGASTAHKKVILFANTLSDADCTALIGTSYDTFADMAEALNYTVYE